MLLRYKTVLKEGEAEIIEKKSRFIATVRPVKSEDEAKAFIEEMRKKYWNATHNVFAYAIGEKSELQRFSDDNEPSGTAGMPVLNVLNGEEVKNTAIVVTRYFGGTLLGTGGLVRAYGKSAKEGLAAAGVYELVLYNRFSVCCDYHLSGKIQYEILNCGAIIEDTLYTDKVEYVILAESGEEGRLNKTIAEASQGKCEPVAIDSGYGYIKDGKVIFPENI